MIADIVDSKYNVRLITRNVMSVFSTDTKYTDAFILSLKHSNYLVCNKVVKSSDVISYIKKTYNLYENVFNFAVHNNNIDEKKFVEYLQYLELTHVLWLHFYQLSKESLCLVEILLQLSSNKPIIIIDYIDDLKCKNMLYTLLFNVGLEDKLIIVPFRDIVDAVNNSTCQCYIKDNNAKIKSRFSELFIKKEFNTSIEYYSGLRPHIYEKQVVSIQPTPYKYSMYEMVLIWLFNIKMLIIAFNNWRLSCQ